MQPAMGLFHKSATSLAKMMTAVVKPCDGFCLAMSEKKAETCSFNHQIQQAETSQFRPPARVTRK